MNYLVTFESWISDIFKSKMKRHGHSYFWTSKELKSLHKMGFKPRGGKVEMSPFVKDKYVLKKVAYHHGDKEDFFYSLEKDGEPIKEFKLFKDIKRFLQTDK